MKLLRIITAPFIFGIILCRYIVKAFHHTYLAVKYGGEWITYAQHDRATIQDIYVELLKNNHTNNQKKEV